MSEKNPTVEEGFDEDRFEPCEQCDGHDACRDFGCAVKLGLEHLLTKEEGT